MSAFQTLLDLLGPAAWAGFAVFVRVSAAVIVLPALGERMLSVRVRLMVAVMLSAAVAPAVIPELPLPEISPGAALRILMTETISGLFLGLALRLFILALQTAGAIAAQSTSLSQIMGQAGVDPLPAIGHILNIAALALLMITGFHLKAIEFLVLSYEILPPFQFPDPAAVAEAGRDRVARSFALAFSLAAPFLILSVLYNLTLGAINRAMPQLMVAFVGAPVITLGSIALLFVSAPFMLTVWLTALETFLSGPFR
jgi:flagellar biosynthetic protein FliR